MESVYTADLKSAARKGLRVQVPPLAPFNMNKNMSVNRQPIAAFGILFQTREEAEAFYPDYDIDGLEMTGELGLEFFDADCEFVLGFQMKPGESQDKYLDMWNKKVGVKSVSPTAMLLIRNY